MKLSVYLSDRKYLIALFSVVSLLFGTVLDMQESAVLIASNGLYVAAISWFLFLVYLAIDFNIKKKRMQRAKESRSVSGSGLGKFYFSAAKRRTAYLL